MLDHTQCQDTASIFIAVASYLADSLPAWAPKQQVRLEIPDYPRDSVLQTSLKSSTAQTQYLLQCPDLVRCADRRPNAVRLDSLRTLTADSVRVSVHLPPRAQMCGPGRLEWGGRGHNGLAAANGLFLDMSPYIVGGCVDSRPYALVVYRDWQGWQVGRAWRVMLCA